MGREDVSESSPARPPGLDLESFSLEAPRVSTLDSAVVHCREGHPHQSFTAQAGHQAVYLLDASQQLAQALSLPRLLHRATDLYGGKEALRDIEEDPAASVTAIALQYRPSNGDTLLYVAIRGWLLVLSTSALSASSSSAHGSWRVVAVLDAPLKTSAKDAIGTAKDSSRQNILSICAGDGVLLAGTASRLLLWTCTTPSTYRWRCVWRARTPRAVAAVRLCPDQSVLAAHLQGDTTVVLWKLTGKTTDVDSHCRLVRASALRHSRPIIDLRWRGETDDNGVRGQTLLTTTSDGVSRVWTPFIDEPESMRLIATISGHDSESKSPRIAPLQGSPYYAYLDASVLATSFRFNLERLHRDLQVAQLQIHEHGLSEREIETKRTQARRLEAVLSETPDCFVRADQEGNLEMAALANLNRKPPTLSSHLTLLKLMRVPDLAAREGGIDQVALVPNRSGAKQSSDDPAATLVIRRKNGTIHRVAMCPALLLAGSERALIAVEDAGLGVQGKKDLSHASAISVRGRSPFLATIVKNARRDHVELAYEEARPMSRKAEHIFRPEATTVVDLAWSVPKETIATPLLAIAEAHLVHILQRRRRAVKSSEYTRDQVGVNGSWTEVARLDVDRLTTDPILGIAWLPDSRLQVRTTRQTLKFSARFQEARYRSKRRGMASLDQVTRWNDAFYADYHPDALFEMLRWGCLDAVSLVLRRVLKSSLSSSPISEDLISDMDVSLDDTLFCQSTQDEGELDNDEGCHANVSLSSLSPLEHENLDKIVAIHFRIRRQRALLDASAIRYLAEEQYFTGSNDHNKSMGDEAAWHLSHPIGHFIWAWLSDTQEQILQNIRQTNNNRLDWYTARKAGVFLWVRSGDTVIALADDVARAQYNSGNERDPTLCSLFYFAMGKMRVVSGLWRQALWHPDHKKMLQFLKNDFGEARWKTAAVKNAFALLSQRRFELAASFFLLGDHLSDAVNVCVRNLRDTHLAIALCRLKEGGNKGPVLRRLLLDVVGPDAYRLEDRRTLAWIFAILERTDLALRSLSSDLETLSADLKSIGFTVSQGGEQGCLQLRLAQTALLYKTIAAKAPDVADKCNPDAEMTLALYACNVLMGSGHGKLALAVSRSWPFARPRLPVAKGGSSSLSLADSSTLPSPEENPPRKIASLLKAPSLSTPAAQSLQQEAAFDMGAFDF